MLNKIIKYSLENRLLVIVIAFLLIISGTYTALKLDVDVFPDLNAPTVVIMTEAHGMAPEEVEKLVTFPIETAVNGSTGIRRLRSSSSMGFSIVWVEFDWSTDVYKARQIVSEKLMTISEQLPQGVGSPILAPQSSLLGEILILALTADTTSPMDLRTIAEWNIRPRILSIGGVAQVTIIGGEYKQFQVFADQQKMKHYDVSLNELINAINSSNRNASGGFLDDFGNEYIVRGIARTNEIEEISNVVIKLSEHVPVKLSDVAEVKIGASPKIGDGSYRGKKSVIMTVSKQPNINTIKLTENLNHAVAEIEKELPPDIKINTDVFEQADFIKTSIRNVQNALLEGALFVIIVLILFLMNYRTTIISLLAIPLSILVTILTLKILGLTINTMSLGGMAIAIGSLVDDAIIDVENVFKRLRQNAKLPEIKRKKSLKVIYDASTEIRASILNASLIIIVAFIPLFFLSGMEGRMLRPLGISFIVSLFASLIVAITITPVLCSLLITKHKSLIRQIKGSWLTRNLSYYYHLSLKKIINAKFVTLGFTAFLLIFALIVFFSFGRSFLPPFNEGSLTINIATIPGISLDESNKIGTEAENVLLSMPEISTCARKTGRAELAEHSFGKNVSEIDAPFKLIDRSRSEFLREVRAKLSSIPGIIFEVGQPITHRLDHILSGSRSNIAIKLFGTNLKQMFSLANNIRNNIDGIDGIADLNVEQQVEIPQIQIKPKRNMLAKYGIPINDFLNFIDYAIAGEKISDVFDDEKVFDLVLRFDEKSRDNIEAIKNIMIDTHSGSKIPLSYVANIESSSGPNTINRENINRKIVISVNIAERDLRSVVNDIQNKIDENITLPEGYRIEFGGQFESEEKASRILFFTSIIAILIIFLILFQEFKNIKIAGIILLNLPLALIGGVMAIWASNSVISIPSIIGFITLFGIATRNGILLVSRYQHLKAEGYSIYNTVVKGSLDRLSPILMTALTAALALIPLAIAGEKSGNEIQSPMAIVILGGLLSSTLLNVYIIPIMYYLMNRKN
ncbi:MAG: efflux RND transporter permease subunit [Bacteroidales bacterium]|nr:efflux RND transporter permease subunit [Bacteroidales bacterium]